MSEGEKMPWHMAASIAERLHDQLSPLVKRAKTVGSVRRRADLVGDIELLVEPVMLTTGLFGETAPDIEPIRALAESWGSVTRGGNRAINLVLPSGVKVDLYLCHPPAFWGSLLAIRTGPADLGARAVTAMLHRGLHHDEGRVVTQREGIIIPTETEEKFFECAGLPCVPPKYRHLRTATQEVAKPDRAICLICKKPCDDEAVLASSVALCTLCRLKASRIPLTGDSHAAVDF